MSVPVPIAEPATYVICSGTGLAITTLSVASLQTLVAVIVQTISSPGTTLPAGTRRLTLCPCSTTSRSASALVFSSTHALSAACAFIAVASSATTPITQCLVPMPLLLCSIDGHGELDRLRRGAAREIAEGDPHLRCGRGNECAGVAVGGVREHRAVQLQ